MYGKTIKALMEQHSFDTVYELAKEAGITPMGLGNIVSDKVSTPNRETLKKLCVVFKIEVFELKQMVKKEIKQ